MFRVGGAWMFLWMCAKSSLIVVGDSTALYHGDETVCWKSFIQSRETVSFFPQFVRLYFWDESRLSNLPEGGSSYIKLHRWTLSENIRRIGLFQNISVKFKSLNWVINIDRSCIQGFIQVFRFILILIHEIIKLPSFSCLIVRNCKIIIYELKSLSSVIDHLFQRVWFK